MPLPAQFYAKRLDEEATRGAVLAGERAIGAGGVRDARRAEEAAKVAAAVEAQKRHQ